jgi:hypothetical protein
VQHAYVSVAEKALISRDAIARETARIRDEEAKRCEDDAKRLVRDESNRRLVDEKTEKERRSWARKKGFAQALATLGWDVKGDQLVCWMNDSSKERRVFLQAQGFGNGTYATLYITGNRRHPPDTIEFTSGTSAKYKAAIPALLRAAARTWTSVKIDLETALSWDGDAELPPTDEQIAARARTAIDETDAALGLAVAAVGAAAQ